MKKQFIIYALALCALLGCKDNSGLYGLLTDYDARITTLERLCTELNTNISSLQTIVEAQQAGDYITSITPIKENGVVIGYTITFAKNDPITIYHGQNGKDGKDGTNGINGTNGVDGHTPIIGVAKDTDGVYYWTLDGEWLLDNNGQKLRVSGKDGKDGIDGQNGQDGTNGTNGTNGTDGTNGTNGADGQDGISPQLKIEADYWWISYDNGATWTQLGKAKGDKGDPGNDGTNGTDGQDGDSMFQSVTYDDNNVYFTLANGTLLTISKNSGTVQIVNGAIQAPFSVSATKRVYFSRGNLQYHIDTNTWRFATHQYDIVGSANSHWIDWFCWGTGANPTLVSLYDSDFSTYVDWGNNAISNGGNSANLWRTLTNDEWNYLFQTRSNASALCGCAIVNEIYGIIIFPDGWENVLDLSFVPGLNNGCFPNIYTVLDMSRMETMGAVFLPANGWKSATAGWQSTLNRGYYWSATPYNSSAAYCFTFTTKKTESNVALPISYTERKAGYSVRLVRDVE